ncbi:MAG: CapA family protein, partial [Chloroflexota bacterium]|nr:CapA family protein [Chloroflexota bacterium]
QWVTAKHANFLSRTRAAGSGAPVLIRLTPDDGETISLNFAGDTMFGRRFYDPNEDGDTSDGLLKQGAGVKEHLALLRDVQPLLENADLTTVNLETPLTTKPYIDPTRPRPEEFHPTKDYAFASDPASAAALKAAGVDVVDLGNNHLYDALDQGVADTRRSVQEAGLASFGAGMSEAEAWSPAVVTARGQAVAFIGCTTITGSEYATSYVVSDAQHKGGAAGCDEQTIRNAVVAARAKYPIVVMMIHGGYEYIRTPSDNVRKLTTAAREAGATLVINHHPHVIGGFDWNGTSLVGWTLGNFLFDQTVWPTLESYLLTVQLRRGQVVRAYAEPLIIDGFLPKGVTGGQADYVAREAAGREPGPFLIENGAMEADLQGAAAQREATATIDGAAAAETIVRLPGGWWASNFVGSGKIQMGRDLLWVGTFEDDNVDKKHQEGELWALENSDKLIGPAYAYESGAGLRLRRNASNQGDSVLTHVYRILIEPGRQIAVIGMVRASPNAHVSLQLSWYSDTRGPSDTQTLTPLSIRPGEAWTPFRVEVTAPPKAIAAGLFMRLQPPEHGDVTADLDDIRLIEWMPDATPFSQLYDHIKIIGSGDLTMHKAVLPGAEAWAGTPELYAFGKPEPIKTRGGQ